MALKPSDLNDTDELILDYLIEEHRATTELLRQVLVDEYEKEVSNQYINQRLVRLTEHGHLKNVRSTGVYEFVEDPRP